MDLSTSRPAGLAGFIHFAVPAVGHPPPRRQQASAERAAAPRAGCCAAMLLMLSRSRLRAGVSTAVAMGAASGAVAAALHTTGKPAAAAAPACSAQPPRLRSIGEKQPAVTVERVVVLTRHGDRTPAAWATGEQIGTKTVAEAEAQFWSLDNRSIVPSPEQLAEWGLYSPWEESNAPSVTGTLTWLGAASQHANGVWLRDRYVTQHKLLPEDLHAPDVAARSTPFPRCVQSCQKLLLGLYPPSSRPPPSTAASLTPISTNTRGVEPMCESTATAAAAAVAAAAAIAACRCSFWSPLYPLTQPRPRACLLPASSPINLSLSRAHSLALCVYVCVCVS
jgi:hypothetical protein